MAGAWWIFEQVVEHVRAHRPCRSTFEARALVEARIADGTLPTRYRRPDRLCTPIPAAAWGWVRDGGVFDWQGREEQERLGHGGGQIEIEAAAVESLYPVRRAGDNHDRLRVEGAASFRLSHIGDVAAQADLERELRPWCDSASLDVGESTLRAIVVDAIQAHRARQSKP